MIDYESAPKIIYEYLVYVETIKGKSSTTADGYFRDLRTFFRYIKHRFKLVDESVAIDDIDIKDINLEIIKKITLMDAYEYLLYCKKIRKNNEKTRARKVSTIKSFFRYLTARKKLLTVNPLEELEGPKTRKSLPKYLSLEQSIKMLNSVNGQFKERNYAIITIFLNCGLRLSELCAMNINDLNFEEKIFKVRGKGNKERIVYLNDACVNALKDYLKIRLKCTTKEKDALFLSRNDNRLSRRMVEQLVSNLLRECGLSGQGFSTHKLRHTAATLMYQHGNVDIRVLQEILGHENLGTTEIYTHLSNTQIKNASESNPLAGIKKQ